MHPFPIQSAEDKAIGDELLAKVKDVLETYVDPYVTDRDGEYSREALDKLAEIGLFGMKIPKEYGGLGLSVSNYARVLGMVGSYCGSTVTYLSAHQSIGVPEPLKTFGTEEQKKNVRKLIDPEPVREISLVIQQNFIREGQLNAVADTIKKIIPQEMLDSRLKKFAIKI